MSLTVPCKASFLDVQSQALALLTQISQLRSDAVHAAEIYDLREVETSLRGVCDALEIIKDYTSDPTTDYTELWQQREQDHAKLRDAQKSWIQTEIFKVLLTPRQLPTD